MSVKGRSTWSYIISTYCDYGELGRATRISRHYSHEAALKAWKKYLQWYANMASNNRNYNVWQVERATGDIIRSHAVYGHKKYGPIPA